MMLTIHLLFPSNMNHLHFSLCLGFFFFGHTSILSDYYTLLWTAEFEVAPIRVSTSWEREELHLHESCVCYAGILSWRSEIWVYLLKKSKLLKINGISDTWNIPEVYFNRSRSHNKHDYFNGNIIDTIKCINGKSFFYEWTAM